MAILKIATYLENRCMQSENKLNFDPLGQKLREYLCNSGTFLQIPDFMPKYGNFENWLVSQERLPVGRK